MDTKPVKPDRSKINLEQPHELKYWKHALDVPEEQIRAAIDKVGNSAAAVRKELGLMGNKHWWIRTAASASASVGCENHPNRAWDAELGCVWHGYAVRVQSGKRAGR